MGVRSRKERGSTLGGTSKGKQAGHPDAPDGSSTLAPVSHHILCHAHSHSELLRS